MLDKNNKINEEYSQGKARAIVSFLITCYMIVSNYFYHDFSNPSIFMLGMYFTYSLFNLYHIKKYPKKNITRRIVNIIGDVGVISYALYSSSTTAVVLYPVLLWIIVGNGLRFGTKYLMTTLVISEMFFVPAMMFNNNWEGHRELGYSLSFGLFILSMFFAKLIDRMHHLNETLEGKVEQRVQEIEYQYLHDTLTDLKNRESLSKDLNEASFSGIFVIDIDEFHNYNDLYGIPVGNKVLKEMAKFLKRFAQNKSYEVYRIYSDHFVLRNNAAGIVYATIEQDMEELFKAVEEFKIKIEQYGTLDIDITVGISLEKDKALKKAEMALSYAKKNNMQYIAYSKLIDSSSVSQELLMWRNEIKKALQTDNIIPLFQPIVNRDQEIVKYESLMRLRREKDGKEELVSPFFFLDIAFKSKQYEKLTMIMIEKSFKFAKKINADISINLSFEDIVNPKIKNLLKEKLHTCKLGEQMIFEIVESSDIDNFEKVKEFIGEFRQYGVRFSIDDFGSGYSNFANIFEIAPDYLKIDGSLVKNIDIDTKSYLLVASITSMAKQLNMKTVAEFVSKKEIFDICYKLGIDYFQGYYFSEPLKAEEVLESKGALITV